MLLGVLLQINHECLYKYSMIWKLSIVSMLYNNLSQLLLKKKVKEM